MTHTPTPARALALVTADVRQSWNEEEVPDVFAHVRDVLTLPGAPRVVGAFPIEDDGSELAAAYILILTMPAQGHVATFSDCGGVYTISVDGFTFHTSISTGERFENGLTRCPARDAFDTTDYVMTDRYAVSYDLTPVTVWIDGDAYTLD